MKKESEMPKALSLIEQKRKLDAAKINDEKAYTELLKQALNLCLEKTEMDNVINELLCNKIDFHFLKRSKKAGEILLNNINFLEGDYLNTIKDQMGKWPTEYDNILYFKKYSDIDASVKCVHWDECEGYWDIVGVYGDDFDYLYDRWDLRDYDDSSDAVIGLLEKVVDVNDLDNLNYYHDNYHWDEAYGQYRDFLNRNFVSYWKNRLLEDKQEEKQRIIDYAKDQLPGVDLNKFFFDNFESLADCDEATFQFFIDKIARQRVQIERLALGMRSAEDYIKVLQESKGR